MDEADVVVQRIGDSEAVDVLVAAIEAVLATAFKEIEAKKLWVDQGKKGNLTLTRALKIAFVKFGDPSLYQ